MTQAIGGIAGRCSGLLSALREAHEWAKSPGVRGMVYRSTVIGAYGNVEQSIDEIFRSFFDACSSLALPFDSYPEGTYKSYKAAALDHLKSSTQGGRTRHEIDPDALLRSLIPELQNWPGYQWGIFTKSNMNYRPNLVANMWNSVGVDISLINIRNFDSPFQYRSSKEVPAEVARDTLAAVMYELVAERNAFAHSWAPADDILTFSGQVALIRATWEWLYGIDSLVSSALFGLAQGAGVGFDRVGAVTHVFPKLSVFGMTELFRDLEVGGSVVYFEGASCTSHRVESLQVSDESVSKVIHSQLGEAGVGVTLRPSPAVLRVGAELAAASDEFSKWCSYNFPIPRIPDWG